MVEVIKCPPGIAEGSDGLHRWSGEVKGLRPVEQIKKKKRKSKRAKKKERVEKRAISDNFYNSYAWRKLRYVAIKMCGAKCQCCGRSAADGFVMHVDHIKPRKKFPELALSLSNLQVLCNLCNHGKGNWDETDWREPRLATLMGERVGE